MFDLDNISVKEFFALDEPRANRYLELQNILKTQPVFLKRKANPLGKLSFGEVAQLKRNIANPNFSNTFESFKIVYKTNWREYITADVVSFFYALNWIRENIIDLMKRETKALSGDIDPDLELAGVKRLSRFGELTTLIAIGQKFGKSPMDVELWSYNMVFSLMLHEKVQGEIAKNYQEIKKT